jgi:small-conductance mechanosensitive channel
MIYAAITISSDVTQWLISAGILAIFVALGIGSHFLLGRILLALTRRTKTTLDDFLVGGLNTPIFLALIGLGSWLALLRLPDLKNNLNMINQIFTLIGIAVGTMAVARVFSAIMSWYGGEVAQRTHTDVDDKLIPIIKRIGNVALYTLAIVLILDNLNIKITPLIAGLGVGGLAVAVALQPTLSNFLAGTYVVTDAVIRKGHYILLDTGQEGLVEDIGWRTTKIRHWQGNLIVLPNSKLADAVVTDFEAAEPTKFFAVACGVSYNCDLDRVEQVALEVANETIKRCPEACKDHSPTVHFKEFGDSNINFTVVLKAVDRVSQFPLKHEFIKALHRRFKQEGITIEYPMRKLLITAAETQSIHSVCSQTAGDSCPTQKYD